eukprot:maker-scaffold449_size167299-snap-gene-0.14 protein:Tk10587 transcript:maker-scaffold449_size167299-snap-gene-0.14-mRNA-1 annotation:"hypothetical protein CRE_05913"
MSESIRSIEPEGDEYDLGEESLRIMSGAELHLDDAAVSMCKTVRGRGDPPSPRKFNNQVGGHCKFLWIADGMICKPKNEREAEFYKRRPQVLRQFLPKCFGIIDGKTLSDSCNSRSDPSVLDEDYMILENLTSQFDSPCVLDLKMGTRMHGDSATPTKIKSQTKKCLNSTSASSLLIVYEGSNTAGQILPGDRRDYSSCEEISSSKSPKSDCDSSAEEGDPSGKSNRVIIKMIDFAHSTFKSFLDDPIIHPGPDKGYLKGLETLISTLKNAQANADSPKLALIFRKEANQTPRTLCPNFLNKVRFSAEGVRLFTFHFPILSLKLSSILVLLERHSASEIMGRKRSILSIIKDKIQGGSNSSNGSAANQAIQDEQRREEEEGRALMETELEHELAVAFDTYSKGLSSIPCKEIGYILRSLGQNPTEDDIVNLVSEAGCSWEGYLTREDFVKVGLVALEKQANRLDDVRAAFRAFDHNNDGSISKDELKDAMTRYGHTFSLEEAEEMFAEADLNEDGKIDFNEFLGIMMQSHHSVNYATNSTDCGFSQNHTAVGSEKKIVFGRNQSRMETPEKRSGASNKFKGPFKIYENFRN